MNTKIEADVKKIHKNPLNMCFCIPMIIHSDDDVDGRWFQTLIGEILRYNYNAQDGSVEYEVPSRLVCSSSSGQLRAELHFNEVPTPEDVVSQELIANMLADNADKIYEATKKVKKQTEEEKHKIEEVAMETIRNMR